MGKHSFQVIGFLAKSAVELCRDDRWARLRDLLGIEFFVHLSEACTNQLHPGNYHWLHL